MRKTVFAILATMAMFFPHFVGDAYSR